METKTTFKLLSNLKKHSILICPIPALAYIKDHNCHSISFIWLCVEFCIEFEKNQK